MTATAQLLLDSVDQVIGDHGPSGVTMRRVGAAVGLSHTAAVHHYKDKQGLFTAYLTRAWERVADGVEAAAALTDDREALLAVADSYAAFALAEPAAFSVMSRLELGHVDTPALWTARERGFFALAGLVERAQGNGWATGRDVLDLVATTWSLVHGFVELWVGGPLAAPYDGAELRSTLRRIVDDLLEALDG